MKDLHTVIKRVGQVGDVRRLNRNGVPCSSPRFIGPIHALLLHRGALLASPCAGTRQESGSGESAAEKVPASTLHLALPDRGSAIEQRCPNFVSTFVFICKTR